MFRVSDVQRSRDPSAPITDHQSLIANDRKVSLWRNFYGLGGGVGRGLGVGVALGAGVGVGDGAAHGVASITSSTYIPVRPPAPF